MSDRICPRFVHGGAIALLLTLTFFALPAFASEASGAVAAQADLEREMCEHTRCQHGLHVVLNTKDGKTYDQTFAVFPGIVQPMGITVVAGQTVHVEADVQGDRLVNLIAVDTVVNPGKTITAKFEQDANGGMLLTLDNPFDRSLKFDMGMMPLDSESSYKTSSCPVIARGQSFEMWPHPIFQLLLGNARLLKDDAPMACAE